MNDEGNMPAYSWLYCHQFEDASDTRYGHDNLTLDRLVRRQYQDVQNACRNQSNLGRASALIATVSDAGDKLDYDAYLDKKLRPMRETLLNLPVTGVASYSKVGPIVGHRYWNEYTADSDVDAWLTLTGDGVSLLQVFEVDADELNRQLASLGCTLWSLDLVDVPENASVVVNCAVRSVTGIPAG